MYDRDAMDENFERNHHLPVYNIKAVSRLVGLLPVTLRAWERRYGLPRPGRGEQGYRLYSEHDVRTLRWLKAQIESGLSIGRAVEYLSELRSSGYDPAIDAGYPMRPSPTPSPSAALSLGMLHELLLDALVNFDEPRALEVMRRAFALYSVDQVLMEVVVPTLVTLGDAWHRGELPIAVEHYATQFCMQHLMSMLAGAAPPSRYGSIVAACAPGEQHQIGLLMLVVMLRWRGWNIKYLGPDLPLDRLAEALRPLRPHLLMFSANRIETADQLADLADILRQFPPPHPKVVLGGQAFTQMRPPEKLGAVVLNESPTEMVLQIEAMMAQIERSSGDMKRNGGKNDR